MSFTHFGPDLNQREDCRKNRWIWYENDSYSVWMDLLLLIKRKKEIFFVIFSSCDKILWPKLCVLCNDETCWRYILYIYIYLFRSRFWSNFVFCWAKHKAHKKYPQENIFTSEYLNLPLIYISFKNQSGIRVPCPHLEIPDIYNSRLHFDVCDFHMTWQLFGFLRVKISFNR